MLTAESWHCKSCAYNETPVRGQLWDRLGPAITANSEKYFNVMNRVQPCGMQVHIRLEMICYISKNPIQSSVL